jgi:hypothetical protein
MEKPAMKPGDDQYGSDYRSHTITPNTTAISVVAISRMRRENCQRSQGATAKRPVINATNQFLPALWLL